MTFIETLIISIISALVAGFLSIFGVVLTLRQNNKQLQAQLDERKEEKQQKIIDNRPEFEIVERKCFFDKMGYTKDDTVDIDCMATLYGEKYSKNDFKENLVMVEYILKNVGQSKVEFLDLCFYDNEVELLDMTRNDIDKFIANPDMFPTTTFFRYAGRKIHHNEEIKIRIWYRANNVIRRKYISYPSFIGIKSFDKRFWYQNFDAPYDGLEDSTLIDHKEYFRTLYRKDQWGK